MQYDVVPPDNGSVSSLGKRVTMEEQTKKKNPAAVKISPWTLARLNAEDVSKAAAEARKKSKILKPVIRHEPNYGQETDSSFGSSSRKMALKLDNNNSNNNSRKRGSRRIRLPADMPLQSLSKLQSFEPQNSSISHHPLIRDTSTSLGPLNLEARSDYRAMPAGNVASSPESSLDSPDILPFRVSSSGASATAMAGATQKDIPLSRSTSDGYDASGGEDSDRVPTRFLHRPNNWNNLLFGSEAERSSSRFTAPTTSTFSNHRNL